MILPQPNFFEPESGNLIEDRPFIRDRVGQNNVEGGKAIGRDKEEGIAEIEDFAHLAAAQFRQAGQIE